MNPSEILRALSYGERISLATWYGEPLSRRDAESWLAAARAGRHGVATRLPQHFGSKLAEMVARYWAEQDARMAYENLLATTEPPADKARLELCYGQLLLARKLQPAWKHLDTGFESAANLFEADEYFLVLKRHECLRQLVLSQVAADAAGLEELLQEARVIARLRGKPLPFVAGPPHQDTLN